MTTTSDRTGPTETPTSGEPLRPDLVLEADLSALRVALADHPFPTHQDDLLALLVHRREPARLACRLSTLSRTRSYDSLDDLCAELRRLAS